MKYINITPSLVTFVKGGSATKKYIDARIKEIKKLHLKEISLFLTGADINLREYVKKELQKTEINSINHIHLRHDMNEAEAQHYFENYKTRKFTIHCLYRKNYLKWSKNIRKCIGIENNKDFSDSINKKEITKFGGLVIDLSHYIDVRGGFPNDLLDSLVKDFPIIANHASAILKNGYSWHMAHSKNQYNYISTIPKKYFSDVVSLEIGNSFESQIRYIEYIKKLI